MDILKKGIKSFIFHVFAAALGFLLQFGAARILGVTEFGKYNYLFGLASSISIVFSFGVTFYFPKVFQQGVDKKKLFSGILFSSSIIYIIFIILFCSFYNPIISSPYDYIILFSLAWLLFIIGYYRSYLIGEHSADKASKIGNLYLKIWILILFAVMLILFGKSYTVLLVAILIAHIIILMPFMAKTLNLTKPNFSFLKHASIFYFIQLSYLFFGEFSKVMQGEFLGMKAVGVLSISLVIGQIITLFGTNFANVGLPIFAAAFRANNTILMKNKFQEIARINAFFLLPIFFFLIYNTRPILGIIGREYQDGSLMLLFILFGSFINSFVGPNGSLLLMSGKEKIELINGIVKFIVACTIAVLFGKKYIWGIALGLGISDVVVNLLKGIEVYYFFRIMPFKKREAVYFIIVATIEATIFYILTLLKLNILLLFIFGVTLIILSWIISFSNSVNLSDRKIYHDFVSYCKRCYHKLFSKL